MRYGFRITESNSYIILGDGNTISPEDIVKELSTLARVTAERDKLIGLINMAIDAIDHNQYPNTLAVMNDAISRIEEGR